MRTGPSESGSGQIGTAPDTGAWQTATRNRAGVSTSRQSASLWAEQCSSAEAERRVDNAPSIEFAFDWQVTVEGWWENVVVELREGAEVTFRGGSSGNPSDEPFFLLEPDATKRGSESLSYRPSTDRPVSIRFAIEPSDHCSNGDHVRTQLAVTNFAVSRRSKATQ